MNKKLVTIESLALTSAGKGVNINPAQFADTTFQNYAEKIASDYTDIIKARVLPNLKNLGDLKLRELRILICLHFFDIPITPAQVAEILRFDPATVSRAIRKMEKVGKLTREDNGKDKRSIRLKLTAEGIKLAEVYVDTISDVFNELEQGLLYGLSAEEKTTFLNVMVKISRRAEAMKVLANI